MSVIDLKLLQETNTLERCPFPIPAGWFFVDYSKNLAPGEVRNVFLLDQEWVLFRGEGEDGKAGLSDPFCPHLGAHLGHGGTVVGDNIRCTFHHWQFNPEGWCKDVPYAKIMPPVCKKQPILRTLPVIEKWGMIWCWYHPQAEAPQWELPSIPELESDDYIEPRTGHWEVNTAVQEVAENGVDFAHLKFLHGEPEIPPATAEFKGHEIFTDMKHGYIKGHQCGPGLAIFRFNHEGVIATMVSYSVPYTREQTKMNMSFTHFKYPEGTKEAMVAEHLVKHMVGEADGEESAGFESVDFIVWNNKKYRPNPLLCDGDGPILQYRKWFKQFYPGNEENPNL